MAELPSVRDMDNKPRCDPVSIDVTNLYFYCVIIVFGIDIDKVSGRESRESIMMFLVVWLLWFRYFISLLWHAEEDLGQEWALCRQGLSVLIQQ